MKKTMAFAMSIIMAVTMTPMIAFATGETEGQQNEQQQPVTEPVAEEDQVTETPEAAADTNGGQAEEIALQEIETAEGEYPDPDPIQTGPVGGANMNIYGLYLGGGEYGDAVLIESNGKYLLMDTGSENSAATLVQLLKKKGITKLDVYISHMHGDHTGGLKELAKNFDLQHVYFPDIELCKEYKTPNTETTIDRIYEKKVKLLKGTDVDNNNESFEVVNPKTEIIYLAPSFRSHRYQNVKDTIYVGAVTLNIVGPVGTYHVTQFASQDGKSGTMEGHYLNNCSLSAIISCGSFRYFSGGDIETQEESALVNRYNYGLDCNMMKLSHHGLNTSNQSTLLSRVTPMWSFVENHGYASTASRNRAQGYGYNYAVASNGRAFIATINDNAVRIFRDYNNNLQADDGLLTGWVNTGGGYQYYDGAGYIHTGWNWISGNAYYLYEVNGFRLTGKHWIGGVKCKFKSDGRLYDPQKPSKGKMSSAKAKKGQKVTVRWNKASRASGYLVYRSTSKNGNYVCIGNLGKKKRSMKDIGLVKGQKYYYRVQPYRVVAGAVLYGSTSSAKKVKAK